MKGKVLVRLGIVASLLASCGVGSEAVETTIPVLVLEKPYPSDYPSGRPMDNTVIAKLEAGKVVDMVGIGYGKDYKYYKVRLASGETGFVIYDGVEPFAAVSTSLKDSEGN